MNRPLSFCMATTFYPPYSFGGDAIHVWRLSNELARRGHQVTVVHSADAYRFFEPLEPSVEYANEPGVSVTPIRTRTHRLAPVITYLSGRPGLYARRLSRALDKPFDVVHFHNVSLLGGPRILSYGTGVKLYTLHEHWLVCPMHVLFKNRREPCEKPQCFRCSLAYRRPPQPWRATGLLERELANVDLFLSPSRFTIDAHRVRGFTAPIRHLPYFVPKSATLDRPPVAHGPRPYFLFVGRLEPVKGVETLIDRFRDFPAADLVVAGHGDLAESLRRQAAGLDNVRLVGLVHSQDLPDLYAGATALIVPSVGVEAFGVVMLEAFAQRTPVIVRDLGALPEVVAESGGGLVYRTQEELGSAMRRLLDDPDLRARLGESGHAAWRERWTEDAHVESYFDAIDEARSLAGQ
jgi:glycosyltransferase involved in cell wall biosynthesis